MTDFGQINRNERNSTNFDQSHNSARKGGSEIARDHKEKIGERVSIYLRGKTWWASYQLDRSQQRESLATASQKEARRKALVIEAELLQGKREVPPPPMSIQEVIPEYLNHLEVEGRSTKTLKKYRQVLGNLLLIAGERRILNLSQMNLRFLDHYRRNRKDAGNSPKTIHNKTTIIRQMVNFAFSRQLISKDPLKGLKNPKPRPTEQPCWSPDETELILAAAKEPQQSIYLTFADTGMRFGEVQWLTWSDIDFDNGFGLIHIRPKDGWQPKSGDARQVHMTLRLRTMLLNRRRATGWVFSAAASKKYPNGGQQISERRLLRSLKRLLKRIALPEAGKLHTFRHSFISKALATGIPSATVRAWVGHVSEEILALYTHVLDGHSQNAMQRFSDATPTQPSITNLAQSQKGSVE
jgi:integrase